MDQPNVLVVLSDQQRPDSCGVFGQRLPVTPRLDALAADGVAFEETFTVQPVCGPARAAIQTGLYPTTTSCWRNGIALPPGTETLADRMNALGYQTGYIGKWHLASNRGRNLPADRPEIRFERKPVPPERRGGYRDVWVAADALEHTSGAYRGHVYDESGRQVDLHGFRVDALTDIAIERLDRFDEKRPFFMFVSFLEPHHQNDRFRTIGPKGWATRFRDFDRPGDLPRWRGDWRWSYAAYLACCASIDANLGRLLDHLERRGRLDDTLVVFTSDHGSHFRTRNLEYKRSPHDASIRVPLVIAGPGFRGGERRHDFATNLDLLPTIVSAAGGEDPGLDGRDLRTEAGVPDEVFVQISESQIGRAIRTPTHTYAAKAPARNPFAGHLRPSADRYVGTHLYDNERDPHQLRNLIDAPDAAEVRERLTRRLAERIEQVEGTRPTVT
ncbi:MAG: sulfatase-like hydrolase/transferase [Acidimicrobiales bacterium]|nr:sulfatase-like hydrolase/transferase [Acidimicrobiales bacterium]